MEFHARLEVDGAGQPVASREDDLTAALGGHCIDGGLDGLGVLVGAMHHLAGLGELAGHGAEINDADLALGDFRAGGHLKGLEEFHMCISSRYQPVTSSN